MMPTAMKIIPAMSSQRQKKLLNVAVAVCELLPLKNDPVGVCAEADDYPSHNNVAAITH